MSKESGERKNKDFRCPLIDPTFVEYKGTKWLFGTTREEFADATRKLSIFIEKDGIYVPYTKKTVKYDVNSARLGGNFFWYKGELYRPAQNSEHIYEKPYR